MSVLFGSGYNSWWQGTYSYGNNNPVTQLYMVIVPMTLMKIILMEIMLYDIMKMISDNASKKPVSVPLIFNDLVT